MPKNPKVGIIYLTWSEDPYQYLNEMFKGVRNQTYPREDLLLIIVYHPKGESTPVTQFIQEQIEKHQETLPQVIFLPQDENWGFSKGNNIGTCEAIKQGCEYIFLHNADGTMQNKCVEELMNTMASDKKIAVVQALILLSPETHLINSAGNSWHYLGFGFCDHYRENISTFQSAEVVDIGYASGAAVIMRADILQQYGLWDEDYFLYHEDTDYSLRLKTLGLRVVLARRSIFFHHYEFSRSIQKYYWMERNRYALLLVFYRFRTLVLLMPMMIVLEVGLLCFSLVRGWWRERLKVYWYWLQPKHWKLWLVKRKKTQDARLISDRELLKTAVSEVKFQENAVQNPILNKIGNTIMRKYWQLVSSLVWW